MQRLSVIGNVSRDRARYPDGRDKESVGGAALHVAVAAARAGAHAVPVSVIGEDLTGVHASLREPGLDLTALLILPGRSASFAMEYDIGDRLVGLSADYGVAGRITGHALARIARCPQDRYHVCCRRPLRARSALQALVACGSPFSVDFMVSSAGHVLGGTAALLAHSDVIFTNADEYRLLERHADTGKLRTVVVTDGPRTVRLFERGRLVLTVVPPAVTPSDVTGAGDTLAGTFLAHRLTGHGDSTALEAAVCAASTHVLGPSHHR